MAMTGRPVRWGQGCSLGGWGEESTHVGAGPTALVGALLGSAQESTPGPLGWEGGRKKPGPLAQAPLGPGGRTGPETLSPW